MGREAATGAARDFGFLQNRPSPRREDGRYRQRNKRGAYSSLSFSIIELSRPPLRLEPRLREEPPRLLPLRELEPRPEALRELDPPRLLALRELPLRLEPALRLREPLREPLDCDDLGMFFPVVFPGRLARRDATAFGSSGRVKPRRGLPPA
jgi:hypothetical protein